MIEIRYAQIRSLDLSNGEGVGIALFVQGCHFHCPNCFNPGTWDFDGGKEWTEEVKNKFLELANRPYIKRISILGGEPLAEENLDDVLDLVNKIRLSSPKKSIWLYSGYTWKEIFDREICYDTIEEIMKEENYNFSTTQERYNNSNFMKRCRITGLCDVLVDGRYVDSQRDITLPYRGSKNQRIIDIRKSLKSKEVILWEH